MIDAMTLADAGDIFDYWADNPPTHLVMQSVARLLGWKPKPAETAPIDLAGLAPPGLAVTRDRGLDMPAPVLDVETLRARNRARLPNRGAGL